MAINRFLVLTFFALIIILSITKVQSLDAGWHIRTGEYIFTLHRIPFHDNFSHTAQGKPYLPTHWLFSLILFLVSKYFGITGMIILKAAVISLTFLAIFKILQKKGVSANLAVFIMGFIYLSSQSRFILRPEIFSFLFLATFYLLLERYKISGNGKLLLILPILTVIWSNLHAGVLFGLILLGGFVGAEFLTGNKRVYFLMLLLVTLLASGVNPTLFRYIGYVASHLGTYERLGIFEFQPTAFEMNPYFWIYLLIFILSSICRFRKLGLFEGVISFSFAYFAARNFRMVPFFMLVSSPVLARNLSFFKGHFIRLKRVAPVAMTAFVILFAFFSCRDKGLNSFGLGINERTFPVKGASFLAESNLSGNIYNDIGFGGYLIWNLYPRYKVFLDGRLSLYEDIYDEFSAADGNDAKLKGLLDKYDVNIALVSYPYERRGNFPIMSIFFSINEKWVLVYWDDICMVYAKDVPENKKAIERFGFRYGSPVHPGHIDDEDVDKAIDLLTERSIANAESAVTHMWIALLQLKRGDIDKAIDECEKALKVDPMNSTIYYHLAQIHMRKKDYGKALPFAKKALSMSPENDELYNLTGVILAENGRLTEAKSYWQKTLRINPENRHAERNLSSLISKK